MDQNAASALAFCRRAVARLARLDEAGVGTEGTAATPDDAGPMERSEDGFVIDYVVLEDDRLEPVRRAHLRAAGLRADALHEAALANLAALVRARAEVHHYGRIHAVLMGADLEASVLLCAPFWDEWQATLAPGGFVAAIPGRDVLAFGDAASPGALRELDDLCTRMAPAVEEPLADQLYRRVAGRWVAAPSLGSGLQT
jgi:hypothetical protein